jgi:hypothetical protein
MKKYFIIPFFFFSCATPNEVVKNADSVENRKLVLPVTLTYSKSVPDSIRDFMKAYLQVKNVRVITFQESIDLIFEEKSYVLRNNIPTNNESDKTYVDKLARLQKPVYNQLRSELFSKVSDNAVLIDSIKWYVLQQISQDTIKRYHTFLPVEEKRNNTILIWRDFADTVLASGLLK